MEKYYFTFLGNDSLNKDYVQPIIAKDYSSAREMMMFLYGDKWGFQYSQEKWEKWCEERLWYYPVETELPTIEYEGRSEWN